MAPACSRLGEPFDWTRCRRCRSVVAVTVVPEAHRDIRRSRIPHQIGGAMDTHRVGRHFEELAARHLRARGWRILDRNVRAGRKEVDLVIRRHGVVAFVEVKGRRGTGFGHPLEAITWKKRREITEVARAWLRKNRLPPGVSLRFDAVAVTLSEGGAPRVEHVEDAWRG